MTKEQEIADMIWQAGYDVGAQSRQAEIDELVRWLDSIVYCYENHEVENMQKVKEILKKYES